MILQFFAYKITKKA